MVSEWLEPPFARLADVCDGMEALALRGAITESGASCHCGRTQVRYSDWDMFTKDDYLAFRRKFEPRPVRLMVVAESPPKNQAYLYNPAGRTTGWLFTALMKQLGHMPKTKAEGLRELQRRGWVQLDATYEPVDWLGQQVNKRNAIIERDYPLLVAALEELSPDKSAAIILIKSNICKLLDWRLTRGGFNVLNKGVSVPFPSHGQQLKFQAQFALLLKKAGLSDRVEEVASTRKLQNERSP